MMEGAGVGIQWNELWEFQRSALQVGLVVEREGDVAGPNLFLHPNLGEMAACGNGDFQGWREPGQTAHEQLTGAGGS
jgi:hypothetical protein